MDERVKPFAELRQSERVEGKKNPKERQRLITEQFPSVRDLDWGKAFDNDIDLFGRIIRDILKVEQPQSGRPGPRLALDYDDGIKRLNQIMGEDYTTEPFVLAFERLVGNRSIRQLASKTGLDRNTVFRLLKGKRYPDPYLMETIAKAFSKHPSYFLEYRLHFISGALEGKMKTAPESTINIYRKITRPGS